MSHRPTTGTRVRCAAAVVCATALAAYGSSACGGSGSVTDPSTPLPPATLGVKDQVAGLANRESFPQQAYVRSFVVAVPWATLQPARGGPVADNNPIDQALAQARAANAAGGAPALRMKLRVFAGTGAPDWAKTLDGPAMTICNDQGPAPVCGTVGRFWTANFGTAYAELQAKLAARYDTVPEILDVVVSRCTTVYAEPLIRESGLAANLAQYQAAGYTLAADQQCQHEQIDAHRVWQHTRSSVAFNPYQAVDVPAGGGAPRVTVDEAFTESLMDYCRATLGTRCVLGNNSIGWPGQTGPMYAKITALGPPVYYQTETAAKVGDLLGTLRWAAAHGAAMVELPAGYQSTAAGDLAPFDTALRANAVRGR